ncbi:glycosyl hydrolase family 32 [Aurantimicrobium minutum]|uniref:glycosyl hydrolase family 32 n=1 Tax=Aurantimicrobium minutum TaxID=708131 RepID=UPI00247499C2|nr:glycosyl hydrolase family 32 [Aurantimicrobium minutum]MDH6422399.1 beta-fructofuranosidase [Aurantimicrobium minutum]
MPLSSAEDWLWDSWYCFDRDVFHAFHLTAPRSLGDTDLRHHNARVGHSISRDLHNWEELPDALLPSTGNAFDNKAIWTGSVVKHAGLWHMFYTGIDKESVGKIQRLGHAISTDLMQWDRVSESPILIANSRWYATADTDFRGEKPFRDPWVFFLEEDQLWHMLITAREGGGAEKAAGTIGHATSSDLYSWELKEPLCHESQFGQMEVLQVEQIDGKWFVIFCTSPSDVWDSQISAAYATYSAPADGPLGPFHLEKSVPLNGGGIYAARIIRDAENNPLLIGFIDNGDPGGFTGTICDPLPLEVDARGCLVTKKTTLQ